MEDGVEKNTADAVQTYKVWTKIQKYIFQQFESPLQILVTLDDFSYVLKCRKNAYYSAKQELTISPYFFAPNLPIFGLSRLAALFMYCSLGLCNLVLCSEA